jgi:hypothetical protein
MGKGSLFCSIKEKTGQRLIGAHPEMQDFWMEQSAISGQRTAKPKAFRLFG